MDSIVHQPAAAKAAHAKNSGKMNRQRGGCVEEDVDMRVLSRSERNQRFFDIVSSQYEGRLKHRAKKL
jgi:hypothetical protein